jgi:hypothetical protein
MATRTGSRCRFFRLQCSPVRSSGPVSLGLPCATESRPSRLAPPSQPCPSRCGARSAAFR